MTLRYRLAAVIGLFAVAAGCDGAARREAERVVEAVDRFRRADNNERPAMIEGVRSAPCTDAEVCRARDACLASTEATAKALRLKVEVEQGLAAIERGEVAKDSDRARALAPKLDEAETLLREGHTRMPACEEQLAALKRRYRF